MGSITSEDAILTVLDGSPAIVTQPTSRSVAVGATTTFTVTATSTTPLSYQWKKNGVAIAGATGTSLNLANVQTADEGNYSVTLSNATASVTSSNASLTVLVPPSITIQPTNLSVLVNQSLGFYVAATGSAPLNYQWFKNGTPMAGKTGSLLFLDRVQGSDVGDYRVTVSNAAGSVTSEIASLTVSSRPSISSQPASQSVILGGTVSFSTTAAGTGPLSYQWSRNGVTIAGATSAVLTLTSVRSSDAGSYAVVVTNPFGSATSFDATLIVTNAPVAPTIITSPADQSAAIGQAATFSVVVSGTVPLTYQWRKEGVNIPGATGERLTLSNLQPGDAGSYSVTVGNSAGSATSARAALAIVVPSGPTIVTPPASQTVVAGGSATFSVSAVGTGALTFQWRKNGEPITNATGSMLVLGVLGSADAGEYAVTVRDANGAVTSVAATLRVVSNASNRAYQGSFTTGESWAMTVADNGTAVFIGRLGPDQIVVARNFTVAEDGTFSFGGESSARSYGSNRVISDIVTGRITGAVVNAQIIGRGIGVTGAQVSGEASSSLVGYYHAVKVFGSLGEVHAMVAPDATLYLVAIDGDAIRAGKGSVLMDGAFNAAGLGYSGTVDVSTGTLTGVFQSAGASPVMLVSPAPVNGPERLANVSTRGLAGTGARTLIAGFVITGTTPQDVLLRAAGPALSGFAVPGTIADPRLRLFRGGSLLAENDDWDLAANANQVTSTSTRVGAFAFPAGSADAALLMRLDPGLYSAQASSKTTSGVALIEVYDASVSGTAGAKLINLSTRGEVGREGDILIAGIVVNGHLPKKLLIRGVGPGLAPFNVEGFLADPKLRLYRGSEFIRENDDWSSGSDAAQVAAAAESTGAFALPSGGKDAALLLYLTPGSYSAQLSGVGDTTGVALIEVYEVP